MPMERDPLASRATRAARAAVAPRVCNARVLSRAPLTVEIEDVAGQTPLTPAQRAAAQAAAEALNPAPRRARRLIDIRADLNALSPAQKNAIWTDLNAGSPPRYALDTGPHAGALFVLQYVATVTALLAAEINEAKLRAATLYVADVPHYLERPAFDPSINVSGSEPIPS